ncbi:transposase [Empedobacter sp.]|uniref:transposase n=1 Tax=Empedobacter sp. TaxID=1927715 RepID=UPI00391B9EBB
MMKGQKNHYEASFKLLAVELSYERSNISELAREIGIKASLLYKWRKDYQEYGFNSFPGKGNLKLTVEQDRIVELEKRLKDAELERDILNKSNQHFL